MMPGPKRNCLASAVVLQSWVWVAVAVAMMLGCAQAHLNRNLRALEQIQIGDSWETVVSKMGDPDLRDDFSDRRFVVFYQTKPKITSQPAISADLCTPIAFENGRVVAIGEDLTKVWARQAETEKRRNAALKRKRAEAQKADAARRRAEMERQRKIEALEREVRPVPAANAALNLTLYRQLLDLDPENREYRRKVAYYTKKMDDQERVDKETQARLRQTEDRQDWEQTREVRNQQLRKYSGNGIAEVAAHDMGNGAFYVWVKNVGDLVITTHPDQIAILGSDGNPLAATVSDSLARVLQPGETSHGRVTYDNALIPDALVFQNPETGRIVRSFH